MEKKKQENAGRPDAPGDGDTCTAGLGERHNTTSLVAGTGQGGKAQREERYREEK